MRNSFRAVRFVAIRRLRFRSVRLVLRIESRERRWMTIFVVREFFEGESRGLLTQQGRSRPKQGRLLHLRLDRPEWLIGQNLNLKIVDA